MACDRIGFGRVLSRRPDFLIRLQTDLIWKSLQAGKIAAEIASLIVKEFKVTEEKAAADAAQFIEQLKARDLIRD